MISPVPRDALRPAIRKPVEPSKVVGPCLIALSALTACIDTGWRKG